MVNTITAIRIVKGTTTFHVHGQNAGDEGIYLAQGQVQGVYEAPVTTTYRSSAMQRGSSYRHTRWNHRDLTLGFHIRETLGDYYEFNESEFRRAFEFEPDMWDLNPAPTTIEVETTLSGVRSLDVLMYEAPEFAPDLDPIGQQYGNYIFKLRAPQPFWYEDDVISTFSSTTASASGTVTVANPTDQAMLHKWVLTRATWTLPDYQWAGPKGARVPAGPNGDRTIEDIVVSDANGGAVVDLDGMELMFRDSNNTNILGQLAGRFFNYAIPPYTSATSLPVSYTGAPSGGAMVQLRQPILWSRPWGLEFVS